MAAGHIIGGQCLDVATAGHALALGMPRLFTTIGNPSTTHLYYSIYDEASAEFRYLHYVNGVFTDHTVYTPVLQNCNTAIFYSDALVYIGAVIALWVTVWAGRALYNFFRLPHADSI